MTQSRPSAVAAALRALSIEQQGLDALTSALAAPGDAGLGAALTRAVEVINAARGRVIVSGMGKSGHIGRKIAATLASTGQPAHFVHPGEASHGDLGMVTNDDVMFALSWSGETVEFAPIITYVKRFGIPLIAMTARPDSAIGREADIRLCLPEAPEACPNGLAPTTSTTMQLVLGDALAIALMEAKGFTARDFSVLHPGGKLGAKLSYVRDIMHRGERIPRIPVGAKMADAVVEMSSKGFGCVGVFAPSGALAGIITDGDLRRHLRGNLLFDTLVEDVMTRSPRVISPDALVVEALKLISDKGSALLVVERGQVVGILNFHDLLRIGAA